MGLGCNGRARMEACILLNGAGMQWKGKNEGLEPPEWGWDAMEGQE